MTMTFLGDLPSKSAITFGSERAMALILSESAEEGTLILALTRLFICKDIRLFINTAK